MRKLTILLAILIPSLSHADLYTTGKSGTEVMVYSEDGVTTADEIVRDADGWPQIIKHQRLNDTDGAAEKVLRLYPHLHRKALGAGKALPNTGTPLWTVTQQWSWAWE